MGTEPKTIVHGTLGENGDTWFVVGDAGMILIDAPFLVDASLEHKTVSISGRMGIPPSAPGITKLIAERIISHEAIASRAYEIFYSGAGRSANDNWFSAERELLGL